jgi:hypothetical protein
MSVLRTPLTFSMTVVTGAAAAIWSDEVVADWTASELRADGDMQELLWKQDNAEKELRNPTMN